MARDKARISLLGAGVALGHGLFKAPPSLLFLGSIQLWALFGFSSKKKKCRFLLGPEGVRGEHRINSSPMYPSIPLLWHSGPRVLPSLGSIAAPWLHLIH